MLDDKDKYLWMNLAEDNELFINFKNKNAFKKLIKIIEGDLRKYGTQDDFLKKILKFFNRIHWIKIEALKDLSFRMEDVIEKNTEQKQLIINYLSQFKKLSQKNEIYYLK